MVIIQITTTSGQAAGILNGLKGTRQVWLADAALPTQPHLTKQNSGSSTRHSKMPFSINSNDFAGFPIGCGFKKYSLNQSIIAAFSNSNDGADIRTWRACSSAMNISSALKSMNRECSGGSRIATTYWVSKNVNRNNSSYTYHEKIYGFYCEARIFAVPPAATLKHKHRQNGFATSRNLPQGL